MVLLLEHLRYFLSNIVHVLAKLGSCGPSGIGIHRLVLAPHSLTVGTCFQQEFDLFCVAPILPFDVIKLCFAGLHLPEQFRFDCDVLLGQLLSFLDVQRLDRLVEHIHFLLECLLVVGECLYLFQTVFESVLHFRELFVIDSKAPGLLFVLHSSQFLLGLLLLLSDLLKFDLQLRYITLRITDPRVLRL